MYFRIFFLLVLIGSIHCMNLEIGYNVLFKKNYFQDLKNKILKSETFDNRIEKRSIIILTNKKIFYLIIISFKLNQGCYWKVCSWSHQKFQNNTQFKEEPKRKTFLNFLKLPSFYYRDKYFRRLLKF
jgi:hypothetical protein